jgi:N-acetylglutamate synthase-like GNAT family acetyltransferase
MNYIWFMVAKKTADNFYVSEKESKKFTKMGFQVLFERRTKTICLRDVPRPFVWEMYQDHLFERCTKTICLRDVPRSFVWETYQDHLFERRTKTICLRDVPRPFVWETYQDHLFLVDTTETSTANISWNLM